MIQRPFQRSLSKAQRFLRISKKIKFFFLAAAKKVSDRVVCPSTRLCPDAAYGTPYGDSYSSNARVLRNPQSALESFANEVAFRG